MKVVVLLGLSTAALIVLPWTNQGATFRSSSNRIHVEADNSQSALPTVTVVDSDGNAAESGSNTGSFRVSRTGNTASALTVRYSLAGSAANGADYATLPGTVTIPAGSVSATIIVDTIDDSVAEGDENVVLTLVSDPAYLIGSPNNATVDMEDDDGDPPPPQPTVTVVDSDGNAAESGSNTGSFRVSRTGSTASALTVRYSLAGSAANGADYATLPGTVAIPAGSVSATIIVDTIDDSVAEGDENVVLTLVSDPAYLIGSPNNATVDMEDDDRAPLPVLSISLTAGQTNDQVMLTWNSEAGRSYQVQYRSSWTASNWMNFAGIITATNSTATTSDFISPDRQRFYRLVLIP